MSRTSSRPPFSFWRTRRQPSPGPDRWKAGCAPSPAVWYCTRVPPHGGGEVGSGRSTALRTAGAEHESGGLPERYHPAYDPHEEVELRDIRRVLDAALGQLPEKYRAPVVLCYLEGKTNEEAARQLGWPPGTMSRRLQRARSLLRQRLGRCGLMIALAIGCGLCSWQIGATWRGSPTCDVARASVHAVTSRSLGSGTDLRIAAPAVLFRIQGHPPARTSRGPRS